MTSCLPLLPRLLVSQLWQAGDVGRRGMPARGVLLLLIMLCPSSLRADWPTHRGNDARTSHVDATIAGQLERRWTYQADQPPRPAWPAPARGSFWQELTSIAPRVVDDHCFHPVVAGGLVIFGSSADDTVRALHVADGRLVWQVTADGPVRYAPCIVGDRVYFGSDDGYVYCVQRDTGQVEWRTRLAPRDRRIPGNGRVISAWPVRTSVVVDAENVYAFAGLFPSQQVYLVALDRATGEVLQRQSINISPQGYLLQDQTRLIVPRGRANPCVIDKSTFQIISEVPGDGGTFALIDRQRFVAGTGNSGTLVASEPDQPKQEVARFSGRQLAVTSDCWYLLGPAGLAAIERASAGQHGVQPQLRWRSDFPGGETIAACTNQLFVGGNGDFRSLDAHTGAILQEFSIEGTALGIAVSGQACFVATDRGDLICFATSDSGNPTAARPVDTADAPASESESPDSYRPRSDARDLDARDLDTPSTPTANEPPAADFAGNTSPVVTLAQLLPGYERIASRLQLGYGVIVGSDSDADALVEALIRETALHLIVLESDPLRLDERRQHWISSGVYGSRVVVQAHAPEGLPFASRFANLLVHASTFSTSPASSSQGLSSEERDRLLRLVNPSRGYAWIDPNQTEPLQPPRGPVGQWTHLYGSPANTALSDDRVIQSSLDLQWFGGPGPRRMVDRHLRAAAPLALNGKMIVPGEDRFICVDSFNGTELWELEVPGSQRYTIPYDCGYYSLDERHFAVAVGASAWIVDTASGQRVRQVSLPAASPDATDAAADARWGYLALVDQRLYGSAMKPDAARLEPSRHLIEIDYGNDQPLVTSNRFFCQSLDDAAGTDTLWSHTACILHPTICVTPERVWFVATQDSVMMQHPTGRITLADVLASAPKLVCLDARTGQQRWSVALPQELLDCTNILYVQANESSLVVSGSLTQNLDTLYRVAVFEPETGELRWQREHFEGKPEAFAHGEQVHHPVLMTDRVIAEPLIYRLSDGQPLLPSGEPGDWRLVRPGHSCGTISATASCLFFRATNPTIMSLSPAMSDASRMQKLAPSRPGCWINIIPADGMVLIPEASASCVCLFSLQTSMAFAPAEATLVIEH